MTRVVFIGDIVDNHAISYHEKDAAAKSILDEHSDAAKGLKLWFSMFTKADVCIGNHDALPFRKLQTAGLPTNWMKSYQEILNCPKTWNWAFTHVINNVVYNHGTGKSGSMAAINFAKDNRTSTVIGHLHTEMSIKYAASFKDLIFGVSVGCLIDREQLAFVYARENAKKEILGCTVIADQGRLPILIPMTL